MTIFFSENGKKGSRIYRATKAGPTAAPTKPERITKGDAGVNQGWPRPVLGGSPRPGELSYLSFGRGSEARWYRP